METEQREIIFTVETAGRLDKILTERLPDFSRSRLQDLAREGCVFINDRPPVKPGEPVKIGDCIRVCLPESEATNLRPEEIPLEILFENDDLLVINKPAGMVVHPSAGHSHGTLANAVLGHDPEMEGIGGEQRPGIVHRLDKDTSGLLLVAKNDTSLLWLQRQFHDRLVKKTYAALVHGVPATQKGRIEAPIGRDARDRLKMAIVSADKGRPAATEFAVREYLGKYSLIDAYPLTGRTHQIRVHLAFIGCPVVGDALYGKRKEDQQYSRHYLHAWRLVVTLPGESVAREFIAPLPEEFEVLLNRLRGR